MGSQCVGRLCRLEATGVETPLTLASPFGRRPDCLTRNALANRNSPQ
ncbi:hypothetical protein [Nostoc sp.]